MTLFSNSLNCLSLAAPAFDLSSYLYFKYGTSFSRLFDNEITIHSGENSSAFVLGDKYPEAQSEAVRCLMFDHNQVSVLPAAGSDKVHAFNCAADLDGDGLADPPEKIHLEFNGVDYSPPLVDPVDNVWPGNPEALGYQQGNSPAAIFGTQPNKGWQFNPARSDVDQDATIDLLLDVGDSEIGFRTTIDPEVIHTDPRVFHEPGWHVVGSGDFNRDGRTDLIGQKRAGETTELIAWFLKGTDISDDVYLTPKTLLKYAVICAVGDFNGDSKPDLVLRNADYPLIIWLMDGTICAIGAAITPQPAPEWEVAGTGDFNHDGKCDILFQQRTGPNSYGQLLVWYMDGFNVLGTDLLLDSVDDPKWKVVATFDDNDDGNADIMFQDKSAGSTGELKGWRMVGDPGHPENPKTIVRGPFMTIHSHPTGIEEKVVEPT